MPKINVNGTSLYYELHGTGEPLLLIAGFNADTLFWRPILHQLTQHFRVLIFDNRGIGQSDCPDIPYSIDIFAKDALKLSEKLELKHPHVLGHSMGGCIAQMLAYQHSKNFNRFVICNSFVKFNPVSTQYKLFQLHLLENGISRELFLEGNLPWLFSNHFLQDPKKIARALDFGLRNPHPPSITGFKRHLEALLEFDSSDWFHEIRASTLIINGMEDIICPHDSEKLAKGIPRAKLINFPKMGHLPMIENPDAFNQSIIPFLRTKDSSPPFSLKSDIFL